MVLSARGTDTLLACPGALGLTGTWKRELGGLNDCDSGYARTVAMWHKRVILFRRTTRPGLPLVFEGLMHKYK